MSARRYPVVIEQTDTAIPPIRRMFPDVQPLVIRRKRRAAISRTPWLHISGRCMKWASRSRNHTRPSITWKSRHSRPNPSMIYSFESCREHHTLVAERTEATPF